MRAAGHPGARVASLSLARAFSAASESSCSSRTACFVLIGARGWGAHSLLLRSAFVWACPLTDGMAFCLDVQFATKSEE